jgi:predicted XRE-type DNA-binding protein
VASAKKDYLAFPTEVWNQDTAGGLRKQRKMISKITRGTTNVFADLGYPDAPERQTKTRLALAVNELLKSRKLKQREISTLLGIPQPKVSALKNYRLDYFSVERLMEFLTALNQDVEIMIRPRANRRKSGHISVLAVQ